MSEPTLEQVHAFVNTRTPATQVAIANMVEAMKELGYSTKEALQSITGFAQVAGSPKQELLHRLNSRLQGTDPGTPIHWRGLP